MEPNQKLITTLFSLTLERVMRNRGETVDAISKNCIATAAFEFENELEGYGLQKIEMHVIMGLHLEDARTLLVERESKANAGPFYPLSGD